MKAKLEQRLNALKTLTEKSRHRHISRFSHINPELVIGLLENGMSLQNIAQFYGCAAETITQAMRTYYPDFKAYKYPIAHRQDVLQDRVIETYEKEGNCNRASKVLKMCRITVSQRLRRAGIEVKTNYRADIKNEDISALYSLLKNTARVAEVLQVSRAMVLRRLHKLKISTERDPRYSKKVEPKTLPEDKIVRDYPRISMKIQAQRYHVHESRIREVLVNHGIEIPEHRY